MRGREETTWLIRYPFLRILPSLYVRPRTRKEQEADDVGVASAVESKLDRTGIVVISLDSNFVVEYGGVGWRDRGGST